MNRQFTIKLITAISAILFIGGCGKWQRDDELTLVKTPYVGEELRTDGYYYLMNSQNNTFIDTYFFYKDGTTLSCGGTPEGEPPFGFIEELLNDTSFNNSIKKTKAGWGVFKIKDNTIAFERWYAREGGLPAGLSEGFVLNDTTFQITSLTRVKTGEVHDKNDLYHFHAFSPKPDSTNNVIP